MKILLIDNYDSFTYNLVHILESFDGVEVTVVKNNQIPMNTLDVYDKVVLSPGPGIPSEAGDLMLFLKRWNTKKPMLGVCLGHQAIAEHFGGKLVNLDKVFHGIATECYISQTALQSGIFTSLPGKIEIGRYHSWVAGTTSFPEVLEVTSTDGDGLIMAFEHRTLPITGVQFHPESVLTPMGTKMLHNWVFDESAAI